MVNDRREVGGSVELHRLQALVVSFQNAFNTVAVRVVDVAVLGRTNTLRRSSKKVTSALKGKVTDTVQASWTGTQLA